MSNQKSGSSLANIIWFALDVLAVMISWYFNKSVLWAIFHFIFGPLYLIYSLIIGRFSDGVFMEIMNSYF